MHGSSSIHACCTRGRKIARALGARTKQDRTSVELRRIKVFGIGFKGLGFRV